MGMWLAPILGVVVVGVIIELISKDSSMGKFVRSIYSFFILFVIIQPLPKLLGDMDFFDSSSVQVNSGLASEINSGSKEARIKLALYELGYEDAVIYVSDNDVYINTGVSLVSEDIEKIKALIEEGNVYIL